MPTILRERDDELAGIDALESPIRPSATMRARIMHGIVPRAWALVLVLAAWQAVAASGWKPSYVLPGPLPVFERLWHDLSNGTLMHATAITLRRALGGFSIAIALGTGIGLAVSGSPRIRAAIGSLISGLQTMPSIAWFPLAILFFRLSEGAIVFVVVLGAAPAIANGLIAGVDGIPRATLRAGRALGARGLAMQRWIVAPAAMPSFVAGLKQGWAFAWRSLMAGELLVIIAGTPSLGVSLQIARDTADATGLLATMVAILIIGMLVDGLVFGQIDRVVRARRGLLGP